MDGKRQNKH